ncbi:MAG TPA: exosortase A [Terriglobales bacterium]|nr:exosortase A [Terriglobales bacterium]
MEITQTVSDVTNRNALSADWSAEWKRAIIVFTVALCGLIVIYWQTVSQLVATWDSAEYSHCYLIVPISLYLIWTGKNRARAILPRPELLALCLLPLFGVVWFAGDLGNVRILQQMAFVGTVMALAWAVFGTAAVRAYRFPLAFLVFAVPFGESVIPPLQDFTAIATLKLLTWSGIPVVMEGHFILVPNGVWEVAEACAGARYLLSSFVLGLVFAHLVYRSTKRRIIFMVLAVVFPIAANAIRAYGIVALGYISDNRIAVGVDHLIYGWIFFSLVTLVLFSIGFRWRETEPERLEFAAVDASIAPLSSKTLAIVAVTALLISAVPATASYWVSHRIAPIRAGTTVPTIKSPWQAEPFSPASWISESNTASFTQSVAYSNSQKRVRLYFAFYSVGGNGIDLNSSGKHLLASQWSAASKGTRLAEIDGKQTQLIELITPPDTVGQRVYWTWYWVNGEFTSSPYQVKALQAKARLTAKFPASAVVAISADYVADPAEARTILQDFVQHFDFADQLSQSFR